ncbi:hypothetical protein [Streptomyces sp. B6B3]|uniref:hypothetical protein n=1 Tax=Streptomyces sp. B6B3 TaxID=3153570 RepID=UPI00325CE47C
MSWFLTASVSFFGGVVVLLTARGAVLAVPFAFRTGPPAAFPAVVFLAVLFFAVAFFVVLFLAVVFFAAPVAFFAGPALFFAAPPALAGLPVSPFSLLIGAPSP